MAQRNFTKNRSNRRVKQKEFEGKNKRKGLGRRRPEKYSYYAYVAMLTILSVVVFAFLGLIIHNII